MKAIKIIIILAVIGGAGYYVVNNYLLPTQAKWLHGTWWYADKAGNVIQGKDKDGMVFYPDGTVELVYGNGKPYLNCVYTTVVENEVRVECEVRGKTTELAFAIENNGAKLANLEDKDGGGYIR